MTQLWLPLACSDKGSIAISQDPKIRFFTLQGRFVAAILAKFGMGVWTSSMPNFAKIGAWGA